MLTGIPGPDPDPGDGWVSIASHRYYVWSGSQVILEMNNPDSVSAINVYGLGQRLGRLGFCAGEDSVNYYVNDAFGSVRAYIDDRGFPGDRMVEYYPYGGLYSVAGWSPHSFIGKEEDHVGELDFGPRYYSGLTGRFLAPDPILSSASSYSYAEGNPVMMYDPTGYTNKYGMGLSRIMELQTQALIAACEAGMAAENARVQAMHYQMYKNDECDIYDENRNYLGSINTPPVYDIIINLKTRTQYADASGTYWDPIDIGVTIEIWGSIPRQSYTEFLSDHLLAHARLVYENITVAYLTLGWVYGVGSGTRHYGSTHPLTASVRGNPLMDRSRKDYVSGKYDPNNSRQEFRLWDALWAMLTPGYGDDYIGSLDKVDITPVGDGYVQIVVTNHTDMASLTKYIGIALFDAGLTHSIKEGRMNSYDRHRWIPTPGGTIKQTYTWREKLP